MIRFIRFLLTAPLSFRLMLIPIRLYPRALVQQTNVNPLPCSRFPWLYTRSNSQPFRTWESFENPSLLKKLSRQAPATPCSASVQDSSARAGTHSGTESMGAFTLDIAWLKSTFAHYSLPRCTNPWHTMEHVKFPRHT